MPAEPPVILASASPRRVELLPALVPSFEGCPSHIPEDLDGAPVDVALALALAKARAVAASRPAALVIGADTIVFDERRAYGKPRDAADAIATLTALAGRPHRVVTGIAIVVPGGEPGVPPDRATTTPANRPPRSTAPRPRSRERGSGGEGTQPGELTAASVAEVHMAALTPGQIAAYVASGRPLDKAGAYAIQDDDVPTVAQLSGCYCAVMGLPLWRLRSLLAEAGMAAPPPDATFPRCASCPER